MNSNLKTPSMIFINISLNTEFQCCTIKMNKKNIAQNEATNVQIHDNYKLSRLLFRWKHTIAVLFIFGWHCFQWNFSANLPKCSDIYISIYHTNTLVYFMHILALVVTPVFPSAVNWADFKCQKNSIELIIHLRSLLDENNEVNS